MKVLFVAPYPHRSADTRYRIEQFRPELQDAGIQSQVRPFMSERFFEIYADSGRVLEKMIEFAAAMTRRLRDVVTAGRFDVVFVHKEAFAFGPPILESLLKRRAGSLVVDLDDAYWTHPPQLRQIGKRLRDPEKTDKLLRLSDHVVAGNPYIAEHARMYNPRVTVIPTVVDTMRYQPRSVPAATSEVTIGWVGRWSSAFYLETLVPVLRAVCARHPHVRVKLIGAGNREWEGIRLVCRPWRLESEIEDLQTFDIGIMPLADDEYSRYKCGFKMIQYMALGIPAVVSPVGVNCDIIEDGVDGYLAATPEEWFRKLSLLIENPALRARLGRAARRKIERRYSLDRALPLLVQVLGEAGGSAGAS